jgi:hypothetical protein
MTKAGVSRLFTKPSSIETGNMINYLRQKENLHLLPLMENGEEKWRKNDMRIKEPK